MFAYTELRPDGVIISGCLHQENCLCSRCRNLVYEAGCVGDLLPPGGSRTLRPELDVDGYLELTITKMGPPKSLLQRLSPRRATQSSQSPRSPGLQPPPSPPERERFYAEMSMSVRDREAEALRKTRA
jgi:hypothetical protein